MSLHAYEASRRISQDGPPFAALIMAAIRKADPTNYAILRESWPDIFNEFYERYHSPGGILPSEREKRV